MIPFDTDEVDPSDKPLLLLSSALLPPSPSIEENEPNAENDPSVLFCLCQRYDIRIHVENGQLIVSYLAILII